ncbi:HTH domain protein [Haloferax gibbonsii]|uniref:HTH domain protein n=1 Tax=Haloferax gibbonsii TaxID=35746 RepID=A0A871BIB3_HALGI|nr:MULTISPECIES: winged helix-turn-helix domain-containing protein [Haloferax]QOS12778.1 HTH domain protein [Haloferax gibbonsii]
MERDRIEAARSFVLSSKYRKHVLKGLARATLATPTELAENTELQRSHLSRAISELREEGIVKLHAPEERTVGRYYGLTDFGEAAWEHLRTDIIHVEWQDADPTSETSCRFVETVTQLLGDKLRFVGMYDGASARLLYADDDARSEYTEQELTDGARELVFRRVNLDLNIPNKECWAQIYFFDPEALLIAQDPDRNLYSASFSPYQDVDISALLNTIESVVLQE